MDREEAIKRVGQDEYMVSSHSVKGRWYSVELERGEWTCTCPDHIYRRKAKGERCKHVEQVIGWLASLERKGRT